MDDDEHAPSYTISPIINTLSYFPFMVMYFFRVIDRPIGMLSQSFSTISRGLYTRMSNVFTFSFFSKYPPSKKKPTKTETYLTKYTEQLEQLKLKKIGNTESSHNTPIIDRTVLENTPAGSVAMAYDEERAAFIYYANTSVPTNMLNVVAKKYALQFHAWHLLQRRDVEPPTDPNAKKSETKKKTTTGGIHSQKIGARFAKLKSATYTKTKVENSNNVKNPHETDIIDTRFICVGRMTDMNVLRKPSTEKVIHNKNSTMTFAEFKKQMTNK